MKEERGILTPRVYISISEDSAMTKEVRIRDVVIGGGRPLAIQSMTNVDSRDEKGLLEQLARLKDAGCDIVRLAIPDMEACEVFSSVREKCDLPLVCDIHFDHRLAIESVKRGAHKIRINPGNIGSEENVRKVVEACREREIPIRVGVNSGSVEKDLIAKYGGRVTAEGLAESALRSLRIIEDMGYDNLVVSIKSSDVRMNYQAHILASGKTEHPFHIGITEAGTVRRGKVKSACGIGALLLAGIGDTVRVSLTADPVEEVRFAKEILESLSLREPKYDLVSCPTCGRTRIDLEKLADQVDDRLNGMEDLPPGLKIAVMGCVVNGPGEAKEADYAVCGGVGKGIVLKKGEPVLTCPEEELAETLLRVIREDRK